MAKYKRTGYSGKVSGPRLYWWTASAGGHETAIVATPHGLIALWRYPGERRPNGGMRFIYAAREHCRWYTPCPTRDGLVRMACREIRKIVGENHEM